jgi:hypothetical protein
MQQAQHRLVGSVSSGMVKGSCAVRFTPKEKPHSLLRNYGVNLVAWGRIELPTRGFST